MLIKIEQLLAEGKTIQIPVQGFSMYPMLYPGRDEAVIAPVDASRLKRGDVVLYRRDESILVLHRIVRRTADGFYMTGDNQSELEGPLREDQMKGILVSFVRKGHRVSVKNPVYVCGARLWLVMLPVRDLVKRPVANLKKRLKRKR